MLLKYIENFNLRRTLQSTIFKNYFFLSVYQVVNFAVPLIVVPFLIGRIGVANFGLVAFSYAFVNYFNVIVDYGFNLSATQKISVNRNNKEVVNRTFTTVYISKLVFLIVCFLLYASLLFAIPALYQLRWLHLCSFTIVIGQALIPIWLFQGMEDMKYLAICNILSKFIYFACILLFIQLPGDYFLVNFFQGLSGIIAGIVSLFIAFRKFNTRIVQVTAKDVKAEIIAGKMLFFSSVAVNIYLNSNAFILGVFASPAEVGIYSVAEKVCFALRQLNMVFSQVIFPKTCLLAQSSVSALRSFLKRIFVPFILLVFVACIVVFFSSHLISSYFLKGVVDYHLILLINIFCISVIINAFNIPAFQTLLAYNEKNKYSLILILGCILNVISNIILVNFLKSLGTVCAVLITEAFITSGLVYYFYQVLKQRSSELLFITF
jgi:PST family polysaccharide transporter